MDQEESPKRSRLRLVLYGALGIIILIPLVGLVVWTQRRPIARNVIDDYLADHGVKARYDIVDVGTERQRIENIVVGDPARPDLIVKWAEVDVKTALLGVTVTGVRASGVRVRGTLVNGKLSFGALDKLRSKSTGEPSTLPDIELGVEDARAVVDTPFGRIGSRIDGKGNLAHSFGGQVALVSKHVSSAACQMQNATAFGAFNIVDGAPRFSGPVRMGAMDCGGVRGRDVDLTLDGTADTALEAWTGAVKFGAREFLANGASAAGVIGDANINYAASTNGWRGYVTMKARDARVGTARAQGLKGHADFLGALALTRGSYTLDLARLALPTAQAGASFAAGDYEVGLDAKNIVRAQSTGQLSSKLVTPDNSLIARLVGLTRSGVGTPLAPLGSALGQDLARLRSGGAFSARYELDQVGRRSRLALFDVKGQSRSGAQLVMTGAAPIHYTAPGGLQISGALKLAGGGFPATFIQFDPAARGLAGRATIAPYQAGDTLLAMTPVAFSYGRLGLNLTTLATLDGSIAGGRVQGLQLPIDIRGGQVVKAGCHPVRFGHLTLSNLDLDPTQLRICLENGGATMQALRLAGFYGGQKFTAAAASARYGFAGGFTAQQAELEYGTIKSRAASVTGSYRNGAGEFRAATVSARFGGDKAQTAFDATTLDGKFSGSTAGGRFGDGRGQIANVPLLMSGGAGTWHFGKGALDVTADATVADATPDPRFYPMQARGFALHMFQNKLNGGGPVFESTSGAHIMDIALSHDLRSGAGGADLIVNKLTFGPGLQPEQLTRLTKSVIANVAGSVSGKGRINWSPNGVTSTGGFRTDGINLAAAFGPVSDLKGEIALSSLLGLETPPGQYVTIGAINPGILVADGVVRYRLLPGLKVQIEGGSWPLAGGTLILEPTTLDMAEVAERRLTFRVENMDAAQFIAQMEFENISATGKMSGVLPMVFDINGGRIEGGVLEATEGGGTLSYIGEVSRENLGTYGSIAFDALKSMKYKNLSIALNGAIDGEMVTQIKFSGVNQAPVLSGRAKFPLPVKVTGLTGIPFIFNVKINAPFRRLMWMARSFQDPTQLIQEEVEKENRRKVEEQRKIDADKVVQPLESESKR